MTKVLGEHPSLTDEVFPPEPYGFRIYPQPSEWDQIVFFKLLDLNHTSPDSSERQYKSGA